MTATARRGKRAAARPSNVIAMPKRLIGTEAIVAEVTGRTMRKKESILELVRSIKANVEESQRIQRAELQALGLQMTGSTLTDFIEIGERMLAAKRVRS